MPRLPRAALAASAALAAVLCWLPVGVLAVPAPTVHAAAAAAASRPAVTPAPRLDRRSPDALDSVGSYVGSLVAGLGSDVSSYVASGIPQFFQDFPVGSKVESALDISDSDLDAAPTQVLNLPPYGFWSDDGWRVRVHGNVFKQPNISQSKLDDLANGFLIGTSIKDLPPSQQDQARNLTAEIYVVQQKNETVVMSFANDAATTDAAKDGGAAPAAGGQQTVTLPYPTTEEGDFDTFVPLKNTTGPRGGFLTPGNVTNEVQTLKLFTSGTATGNATAYLVPLQGVTVISDIDDILRVTKIWDPKQGLLNSFARPFTPWQSMPEIYAGWAAGSNSIHFHYLTTTPEQVTRNYMDFIYKTYPLGSFDTRPLNFSDVSATLSIRKFLLDKIFQTFPTRKFVLVADTSNPDVMKDYPLLYHEHPSQVSCILLRNTSATDPTDKFPYDTSGFKGIPQSNYMFFVNSADLKDVNVATGQCYNPAVPQNVTFDYQGLPFEHSSSGFSAVRPQMMGMVAAAALLAAAMF